MLYGVNFFAPDGFTVGNGGNPLGYFYEGDQFGEEVYLNLATFNNGLSPCAVVTKELAPVYGSVPYVSQGALGFSL